MALKKPILILYFSLGIFAVIGQNVNQFREIQPIPLGRGENIQHVFASGDSLYAVAYDENYRYKPPCVEPCLGVNCPSGTSCRSGECLDSSADSPGKRCRLPSTELVLENDTRLSEVDYSMTSFLIKINNFRDPRLLTIEDQEILELPQVTHLKLLGIDDFPIPREVPAYCSYRNFTDNRDYRIIGCADGSPCDNSTECSEGNICSFGQCSPATNSSVTCGESSYCEMRNFFCEETCVERRPCATTGDCVDGEYCARGICNSPLPFCDTLKCVGATTIPEKRAIFRAEVDTDFDGRQPALIDIFLTDLRKGQIQLELLDGISETVAGAALQKGRESIILPLVHAAETAEGVALGTARLNVTNAFSTNIWLGRRLFCSSCQLQAVCSDEEMLYVATTPDGGFTSQLHFFYFRDLRRILLESNFLTTTEILPGRSGPNEASLEDEIPLNFRSDEGGITSCIVSPEDKSVLFTTTRARILRVGSQSSPNRARVKQYSVLVPASLYEDRRMTSAVMDEARGHLYVGVETSPNGDLIDINLKTMEAFELVNADRFGVGGFVSAFFDPEGRMAFFGTRNNRIARMTVPAACPNNCNGNGECRRGECICTPPWDGFDCSNQECPNGCSSRGECIQGVCDCYPPYSGEDCSLGACPNECSGPERGTCDETTFLCFCKALYGGDDCSREFLPQIPGSLDFLGFGVDLRFLGDDLNMVKQSCLSFSTTENKIYAYPGQAHVRWAVPDQTSVITRSSSYVDTYYFDSLQSIYVATYLGFGVSIPYLSVKIYFENRVFDESSSIKIQTDASDVLYNLVLTDRPLSPAVEEFLTRADSLVSFSELDRWGEEFIETFGTHYVDQVTMGGKMTVEGIASGSAREIGFTLGAAIGTSYGPISLQLSVNVSLDVRRTLEESRISTRIEGGEPSVGSALIAPSPNNVKDLVASWQQTVVRNPVPIDFILKEIYYLIKDPGKRWHVCRAVERALRIPSELKRCA